MAEESTPPPPPLKAIAGGKSSRDHINVTSPHAEAGNPLSDFMVPSADSHGHSARVQVRLPPNMKHQIGLLVGTKKFPFDTESDFGRVAFYRLLRDLEKLAKDQTITNMQSMLNAMVASARIQQEHLHFSHVLDQVGKTLSELLGRNAQPAARKLLKEIAAQIETIDDPYWHDRYKRDLLDRFDHVLHPPPPAPAKPGAIHVKAPK